MGTALAIGLGRFNALNFIVVLVGGLLLQVGTNMTNDVYDVAYGVDTKETSRPGHVLLAGVLDARTELRAAIIVFVVTILLGLYLSTRVGDLILVPVLLGVFGGYYYTAPPIRYKYRGLGVPLVFCLMGPIMVWAACLGVSGKMPPSIGWVSVPIGLLVAAILHVNDLRDMGGDAKGGVVTLAGVIGEKAAYGVYGFMLFVPYILAVAAVLTGRLPILAGVVLLSLPLALAAFKAARGQIPMMIDAQTAQVHLIFGVLMAVGLAIGGGSL